MNAQDRTGQMWKDIDCRVESSPVTLLVIGPPALYGSELRHPVVLLDFDADVNRHWRENQSQNWLEDAPWEQDPKMERIT